MKLRDFKKINESWDKWLSEGGEEVKKIFYTRGDYGYIGFSDEAGADLDIGLGQMVLDLVGAGRTDFAPDTQVQRMMKKHEEGAQGGMQRWDSNVFEDYYDADTVKIINGWAAMNGVEAEEAVEKEPEYEDDGTNDFEEYYSESKKRNKIHELFGFGKKKKEKLNPDGSVCKSCKVLKWATSDNQVQGYEDRFGFKMRWYGKGKGPRMPDDEEYMRGWKKGEEYDAGSQRSKEAGTHDALFESGHGVVVGQTVTHQQEPERGKGKVVAVDNKSAQPAALVIWEGGQQQRHDPRVLKPEGGYAVREGGMSDLHIEIQDALSEIMEQYGVGLEDIEGIIGDMKSDEDHGEWDEADQDHADQEYAAKHGDPWDAAVNEVSGIPDAEQKVANEQAYSKCHQAAMEGKNKESVMSSVVMPHDLPACSAGWDDGNNESKASQRNAPYDAEADEWYEYRHQADQDLRERIKKAVIRKMRENRKK